VRKNFNYIITIFNDAKEKCPLILGKEKRFHHGFDNPPILARKIKSGEEVLSINSRVKDEIKEYVDKSLFTFCLSYSNHHCKT